MAGPARHLPNLRTDKGLAARSAIAFLVLGVSWVLLTDLLLYRFVQLPGKVARLETAKGWAFVGLAALGVYLLVRRAVVRLLAEEGRSHAILESIGDGVLTLGPDGRIVDANPAAVRMLGVEDRDALIGMGAPEFSRRFHVRYSDGRLVPPDEYVSQRAVKGEQASSYRASMRTADGRELVAIVTAAPVRSKDGSDALMAVSVLHDVTKLEQLEQIRDRLFAATAHSLKTPLAIIKGHAQLLARRDERKVVASANAIERQCHRIDGLVQNLLVLVRLRSGTLKLHPAMADVGDVVEEAIRRSGPLTGHHRIVPQLESHAVAFLDSERMALVVRNLVESACSRAQPGADIVLRLEDDGELARIHAHYSPHHGAGPHVRAGPDLDLGWLDELEEHTGLGVGRHVIRKIVEAHGGEFGHEQLEEAQACEWLTIPVSVEETRDAARP